MPDLITSQTTAAPVAAKSTPVSFPQVGASFPLPGALWMYGVGAALLFLVPVGLSNAFGGDAAAWVQAVGSVVAIVASVGIVGWQSHQDKQRALSDARAERIRYLDVATELVLGTAQVSRMVANNQFPRSSATFNSMRADLGALVDALAGLDITQLSGSESIRPVMVALSSARRLLNDIDDAQRSDFDTTVVMGGLKQSAESMAGIIERQHAELVVVQEQAKAIP